MLYVQDSSSLPTSLGGQGPGSLACSITPSQGEGRIACYRQMAFFRWRLEQLDESGILCLETQLLESFFYKPVRISSERQTCRHSDWRGFFRLLRSSRIRSSRIRSGVDTGGCWGAGTPVAHTVPQVVPASTDGMWVHWALAATPLCSAMTSGQLCVTHSSMNEGLCIPVYPCVTLLSEVPSALGRQVRVSQIVYLPH